ncbi:MAG: DUF2752 domain-containing protein [FCB group bacterium]|nr:DUF2752 domain-containing protein [FCB group bacterium]
MKETRSTLVQWRTLNATERMSGVALAAAFAVVFLVALWLKPDGRGFGTHEQLGMRPCTFQQVLHIPCPTCGMTTSSSLMAHGHVLEAFRCQPAGAALFAGGAVAAVAGLVFAAMGRQPAMVDRLAANKVVWAVGVLIVAAGWVYRIITTL